MGKLFGTDGIRGVANQYPMTSEISMKIGQALAYILKKKNHRPRIVVGKDTRLSGYMIETALSTGICSMGADVILVGPMPTPGIAFITKNMDTDAGLVISASHNPFQDNGIKIFTNSGFKLNTEQENKIEDLLFSDKLSSYLPPAQEIGRAYRETDALGRYIVFLRHTLHKSLSLEGMKVVLDCANGATYKIAPTLFREMRAEITLLNVNPNGININEHAGSLYPDIMAEHVINTKSDIGLAFDGDGDRLIVCDEYGHVITGDNILAICANHMKETGELKNDLVVSTVMSNIGLKEALDKVGIKKIESPVGDRFVLEKMLEHDVVLGGEDSGHIIFLEHHTTGDGILTALQLLAVMKYSKKPLSELSKIMHTYPQILENIEVKKKINIESVPELKKVINEVSEELGSNGRVLVRYSGTQTLLRIMAEGPTEEKTKKAVDRILKIAKEKLT